MTLKSSFLSAPSQVEEEDAETDHLKPRRPFWPNKIQFVLACVGYSVGLGNVWRFPYLCYKSGGGAGLASVVISFLMSTYYAVIIAWAIYYFFTSFKTEVPKKVLSMSDGIEFPGGMRWELAACLVCAWVLVYFALWKSIKSSAKVRYITTTLPFLLIIVFLGRSLTLEGADKGLRFFFKPDWELLKQSRPWVNAASQIFNSIGIAFGSMIMFASYNRFDNNFLHDTLAVSLVNAVTSLIVGIFTFATIGNIAFEQNTSVKDVIADISFFFGLPHIIHSGIYVFQLMDYYAASLSITYLAFFEVVGIAWFYGVGRLSANIKQMTVSFFFGLPHIIHSGIYVFQLMDYYAASLSITYLAFFEVVGIAWFYGVGRLSANIKQMTGRYPSLYFRACWLVASPALLLALWVASLVDYTPPSYRQYQYPAWAQALGWTIASLSLLCIPVYAVVVVARAPGKTIGEVFAANTSEVLTYHQTSLRRFSPQEGWVEQDALEILNAVLECIEVTADNLRKLDINPEDIVGVGITNQRETTIVWNSATGQPLYSAIVWLDVRTSKIVDDLLKNKGAQSINAVTQTSGLPLSTYFSSVKLKWLLQNVTSIKDAVAAGECMAGTVDSWLIWNLTGGPRGGVHATDVTNASRTQLMSLRSLQWERGLLRFFDIPKQILPKIKSSAEIYGYISTGSLIGVPIAGWLQHGLEILDDVSDSDAQASESNVRVEQLHAAVARGARGSGGGVPADAADREIRRVRWETALERCMGWVKEDTEESTFKPVADATDRTTAVLPPGLFFLGTALLVVIADKLKSI
ncbi:hypothetical protein MSG28_003438 [Choristoneura fumiferana]|uniref:Uncharacterized protein n=1 Tax=Choristoneura fumiferana TaxID=7141 RepID=A0ACC0KF97_CHOFU|nr:hypothetical protein MSG28_003438 [Choristoneura fumiferana]